MTYSLEVRNKRKKKIKTSCGTFSNSWQSFLGLAFLREQKCLPHSQMKLKVDTKFLNFQWTRKPVISLAQIAKKLQVLLFFFPQRIDFNYLPVNVKKNHSILTGKIAPKTPWLSFKHAWAGGLKPLLSQQFFFHSGFPHCSSVPWPPADSHARINRVRANMRV